MLSRAVLKALVYADIFDYPLRLEEVSKFLIGEKGSTKEIEAALAVVGCQRSSDGFWFLPGRLELVEIRRGRNFESAKKLRRARTLASFLRVIPGIQMLAVTGAAAIGNACVEGDIDLLIVTSPRRLWLVRGLIVSILLLTGCYRRPGKVKDRFCPNLFLSQSSLNFPDHNLYSAHEVAQTHLLWDRGGTYGSFLAANSWLLEHLPNFSLPALSSVSKPAAASGFGHRLLDFLEDFAYKFQRSFMAAKRTNEMIGPEIAAFHPGRRSEAVLERYLTRLDEFL